MSRTLDERVALVIDGAEGRGAGYALSLALAGADVAISFDSCAERAADVLCEIARANVRAIAIQADPADLGDLESLLRTVIDRFGKLDLVVDGSGALTGTVQGDQNWPLQHRQRSQSACFGTVFADVGSDREKETTETEQPSLTDEVVPA
jgi:NAD(P)-dependent dehydrogenase (short-subunit alcohol dehydrogenase family)